jgi:hypothetical protein
MAHPPPLENEKIRYANRMRGKKTTPEEQERETREYWIGRSFGEKFAAVSEISIAAWKAEHLGQEPLSGPENRKLIKVVRQSDYE